MDFSLSTEQRMMMDTVRRFIANELRPLEEVVEETGQLAPETARAIFQKSKALGLFGGMGFCKELPIERYYRDARIYRIFDGTSEIHRTVVARSLLKRGAAIYDIGA